MRLLQTALVSSKKSLQVQHRQDICFSLKNNRYLSAATREAGGLFRWLASSFRPIPHRNFIGNVCASPCGTYSKALFVLLCYMKFEAQCSQLIDHIIAAVEEYQ